MATTERVRQKTRSTSERAAYNAFAESFIRFNTWIDNQCGIAPSTERWPYSEFKKPAVERLLRKIDNDNPMGLPPISRGQVKRRRPASSTPDVRPVEFVADQVNDLFKG